jgi:hypothetical protein
MQQQREEPEAQVEMKSEVDEYGLTESQIESEGQIVDLDSMSLEDLKKLRKKVQRERDEALAKLNLILARDPNLNPVRLEDFPYYATLKKIQKGV